MDNPSTHPDPGARIYEPPVTATPAIPGSGATVQPPNGRPIPALASEVDILSLVGRELEHRGVVGEERGVKLLYLALTSRLLDDPVSVVVKGPSSGGKSYLVKRVLELIPKEGYVELTSMSEKALVYSDEPLVHRVLVIYEASGLANEFASYAIRTLLSEGLIRYETTEKTAEGLRTRVIEKAGPTALLLTTTAVRLHAETETRMISLTVNDSPAQTREILLAHADKAADGESKVAAVRGEDWLRFQAWLAEGECAVIVPFARTIADAIPPVAVRLRRDFGTLLSLVRAHALLHRNDRSRDTGGRIVALPSDYEAVRVLVADLMAVGVEAAVSRTVRQTVEGVRSLYFPQQRPVSLTELADYLGLDKGTVSRRVATALAGGYIIDLQDRPGRQKMLVPDEPLPAEGSLLPVLDALRPEDGAAGAGEHATPMTTVRAEDGP